MQTGGEVSGPAEVEERHYSQLTASTEAITH